MRNQEFWLVLIETASNQKTIFQTNRLRENVGASELIHRVGTRYVIEALGFPAALASDPYLLDALLIDAKRNAPIELDSSDEAAEIAAEIIVATSGKAILLTRSRTRAKAIVTAVTTSTLIDSPGVTARGAIAMLHGQTAQDLDCAIYTAHLRLEELASTLPANERRFARLPFIEDCDSSGMPANEIWSRNKPYGSIGVSLAKRRDEFTQARDRLLNALSSEIDQKDRPPLVHGIEAIEKRGFPWLAIVHADGNGLGGIFLKFLEHLPERPDDLTCFRHYIDTLRRFSIGIDVCTRRATRMAIDCTWQGESDIPLIPVVLGGDDLTVLCDGRKAIDFTATFLRAFEEVTVQHKDVKRVAPNGLSACAGIAIVKPHFPFHRAYDLAEKLIGEAKEVKKHAEPCSAFDFQILFDTSGAELEPIRERMRSIDDRNARLTFRPYVVTAMDGAGPSKLKAEGDPNWLRQHHYERLGTAVQALERPAGKSDGREEDRALPQTQQHALRAALHQGPTTADARLAEIKHRYGGDNGVGWDALLHGSSSLFLDAETDDEGKQIKRTYLLDAMDVSDLRAEGKQ